MIGSMDVYGKHAMSCYVHSYDAFYTRSDTTRGGVPFCV